MLVGLLLPLVAGRPASAAALGPVVEVAGDVSSDSRDYQQAAPVALATASDGHAIVASNLGWWTEVDPDGSVVRRLGRDGTAAAGGGWVGFGRRLHIDTPSESEFTIKVGPVGRPAQRRLVLPFATVFAVDGDRIAYGCAGALCLAAAGGPPSVVAAASGVVDLVQLEGDTVAWADSTGVHAAPVGGGAPETLERFAPGGGRRAVRLELRRAHVLWTTTEHGSTLPAEVGRVVLPCAGGDCDRTATPTSYPGAGGFDGRRVVVPVTSGSGYEVVDLDGGARTKALDDAEISSSALDGDLLWWITPQHSLRVRSLSGGAGPAPASTPSMPVEQLTAVRSPDGVVLRWKPPADPSVVTTTAMRGAGAQPPEAELRDPLARDFEDEVVDREPTTGAQGYAVFTRNALGDGGRATASVGAVGGASAPGRPTDVVGSGLDGAVRLTWRPPADDGGAAVVAYEVQLGPGQPLQVVGPEARTAVIQDVPNGDVVSPRVRARNAVGASAAAIVRPLTPRSPGGTYVAAAPSRILDTRVATPIGPDGTIDVRPADGGTVPASGVAAVVLNVTAIEASTDTFVTVWPTGSPRPPSSNLNLGPGAIVPNLVTAPLGDGGRVTIGNHLGTVHLAVDVEGWYLDGTTGAPASRTVPVQPARLYDSRLGRIDPLHGGEARRIPVAGVVPIIDASTTTAVVVNLTAVNASEATFVTAYPTGVPRPLASNLNLARGQTKANLAIVPLGVDGSFTIYSLAGSAHIAIDVVGFLAGPSSTEVGLRYVAATPRRLLDTRGGAGPAGSIGAGGATTVDVARRADIPAEAQAVAGNLTATAGTADTYLSLLPDGLADARPTSAVNPRTGETVANAAQAALGLDGALIVTNLAGNVHAVLDVTGWFVR